MSSVGCASAVGCASSVGCASGCDVQSTGAPYPELGAAHAPDDKRLSPDWHAFCGLGFGGRYPRLTVLDVGGRYPRLTVLNVALLPNRASSTSFTPYCAAPMPPATARGTAAAAATSGSVAATTTTQLIYSHPLNDIFVAASGEVVTAGIEGQRIRVNVYFPNKDTKFFVTASCSRV